jgi:hypothetical protein
MSSKYSTWNRGQDEALLNILGGQDVAEKIIARKVRVVIEEIKEVYLKRLFTFTLTATNGRDTCETASQVFKAGFDPDFKNWGIVFSGVAPETKVGAEELVLDGKFFDFLGSTAIELEKRRLLGSRFLAICRDTPDKLRDGCYVNFFIITKGDEVVAEDLSNVFVAYVHVHDDGKLYAYVNHVSYVNVWLGDYRLRVFTPQQ